LDHAVLIGLARRLEEHGSWSGETHVQKAAYLVSELLAVAFDFILYSTAPSPSSCARSLGPCAPADFSIASPKVRSTGRGCSSPTAAGSSSGEKRGYAKS
jgi:hypothetical protein